MPADDAGHLRVMTWNLWYEFGPFEHRREAIRQTIAREDPDIVCLQEVFCVRNGTEVRTFAHDLAHDLGLNCAVSDGPWFPRRSSADEGEETAMGNAILSRWPIESHGQVTLPGKDSDAGYRKAVFARVTTPWGAWPVICTHLNHRFDESAVRVRQVDALADIVREFRGDSESDPPVILGETSTRFRTATRSGDSPAAPNPAIRIWCCRTCGNNVARATVSRGAPTTSTKPTPTGRIVVWIISSCRGPGPSRWDTRVERG